MVTTDDCLDKMGLCHQFCKQMGRNLPFDSLGKDTLTVSSPFRLHHAPLQRVRSATADEGDKRAVYPENMASRTEVSLPNGF